MVKCLHINGDGGGAAHMAITDAKKSNNMFQNDDLRFHEDVAKQGVNVGTL